MRHAEYSERAERELVQMQDRAVRAEAMHRSALTEAADAAAEDAAAWEQAQTVLREKCRSAEDRIKVLTTERDQALEVIHIVPWEDLFFLDISLVFLRTLSNLLSLTSETAPSIATSRR